MPKINELTRAQTLAATDLFAAENTSGTSTRGVSAQQIKDFATADVNAEVTDLKNALEQVITHSGNLYNPATDRHGTSIDAHGVISVNANYKATDYIYIGSGGKFTVKGVPNGTSDGALSVCFYTSNNDNAFSRRLYVTANPQTFTLAATESYIVLVMYEASAPFMCNIGETLLPYTPYGWIAGEFLQDVIDDIDDKIQSETDAVRDSSAQKNIINRFNKSTITSGKYLSTSTGELVTSDSFFASDYIDISDLTNVMCSYTHIVCFYDANKAFISGQGFNTRTTDNSIARPTSPTNAVYMRFSTYNADLDLSQIGEDVDRASYIPYGKYTLPDCINKSAEIVVDVNGNGDYTSLTEALYDNVDSGEKITVKPGTYNIVSEYVAKFGQAAVDSMADADTSIFNGFQYGLIIRNREIEFLPGSHVVCDWTGHTVDGTHRFSAIRVDYNCKITGLHLVSTATFYAIHDDYGPLTAPYTVEYEKCYIEGVNLTNANCIGGGCKKYSRHIIRNCYFDNHTTSSATVRYHNTNAEGAEPEIYVSNCYFSNWFTPRWYGTQTSKMKVYVNNCEARAIYKMAESSSFEVDNVELYKWCNTETNPVNP